MQIDVMGKVQSGIDGIRRSIRRFKRDTSGNLSVIFALGLIPLVGAIGAAVDYSKAAQLKSSLQQRLDAAVLAGIKESGSTQQIAKATSYFQAQAPAETVGIALVNGSEIAAQPVSAGGLTPPFLMMLLPLMQMRFTFIVVLALKIAAGLAVERT